MVRTTGRVCLVALVAVVPLLAGCAGGGDVQEPPVAGDELSTTVGPYRLRAGDRLSVRFVTDSSLDYEAPITPNGTISVPLVGEVRAAGKTLRELRATIEDGMGEYLIDPSVALVVVGLGEQPVYVIGQVEKPGRILYSEHLSVSQAVAAAGGLLPTGKPSSVMVVRTAGVDGPQAFKVDVSKIYSGRDLSVDVALAPNDVIYVPRSVIGKVDEFVQLFFENIAPAQLFYLRGYEILENTQLRWTGQ